MHQINFNVYEGDDNKTQIEYYDFNNNKFVETIIKLDSVNLYLTNKDNYIYHYKVYEKLNLDQMNEDEIKIGALLNSFLKKNNLEKGLEKVDAKDAWFKIMKNGVSNYTTDIHLKNKTLYVSLSSSTLREELSYGKEKIINLLNDALEKDAIKKIVLR